MASQTSDYEIIIEFLINHIKKNYKWGGDIAHVLIARTDFNFNKEVPTEGSVDASITDAGQIAKAKESLKLIYEQEIKRYINKNLTILLIK